MLVGRCKTAPFSLFFFVQFWVAPIRAAMFLVDSWRAITGTTKENCVVVMEADGWPRPVSSTLFSPKLLGALARQSRFITADDQTHTRTCRKLAVWLDKTLICRLLPPLCGCMANSESIIRDSRWDNSPNLQFGKYMYKYTHYMPSG